MSKKIDSKKAIVYTINDCIHCETLVDILRRNRVSFKEIRYNRDNVDIERKFRELTGEERTRFPVLRVMGEVIIGLDMVKIESLLKITPPPEKDEEEIELEEAL